MKLHIFQSDKGDCILLETSDKRLVLCDGGMANSMRDHVRAKLALLRKAGREIDYAYVSHIDSDHISGVLQLLEDELEWRVYDFHHENNDGGIEKPDVPRPPAIGGIWHNAFRDQVNQNQAEVKKLLAAAVPALFASSLPNLVEVGHDLQNIAVSIPEALKVSKLAAPELLDIPVNKVPGSQKPRRLLMVRQGQSSFGIGTSRWTIVGPTADELENLKKGWNTWLESAAGEKGVARVRAEIRRRMERFSSGTLTSAPFDLSGWNGIPDYEGVTAPNVASLMFMVEEDGKRILFTGDSHQDMILEGLRATGYMPDDYLHVDVLKVQHHGSEHNMDIDFARRVSADHYIFCGNGEHGNPEQTVLETVFQSRVGPKKRRALAPEAEGRTFNFWFSTRSDVLAEGSKERKVFEDREAAVKKMVQASGGRMKAFFNGNASRVLTV
jgi:beta-lactamase superfamily II metal-dependent hydrolase